MSWKNLTIGKRIAVGFGMVLALLSLTGILSYSGVGGIVDNASEVIDGNKLDGVLAQKEVDHLNWVNSVNALLTDDSVTKLNVQTDAHKCGFGQWYYGEDRRLAEELVPSLTPLLKEIEAPHKHIHESAIKISESFTQPNPGLTLTLANRLNDHLQWVAAANKGLALEAGGIPTYRVQVRDAVNQALTAVESIDKKSMAADLSEKQLTAKTMLNGIRFGADLKDYVFVMDTSHTILVHPNKDMIGRNMADTADTNGKMLFQELAKLAKNHGEGYLIYYWPKIGSEKPVPKYTYVKLYKPWNWIIGTGVFLDEHNKALITRAKNLDKGVPFSLNVQLDPTKCAFGKFLASKETAELMKTFPEFKAAMEEVTGPHNHLHQSAVEIEKAVNEFEMHKALNLFESKTLPALEEVKKHIGEAIEAEEALQKGFNEANRIYATQTTKNLKEVQRLLTEIRKEAKNNIMTDVVMLDAAQGTKRNVTVVGVVAVILGILFAFFIARGISKVLQAISTQMSSGAEQVASASAQVSSASQSLAEGASENAAALEETSSSLEEMSSMTKQNADNASQANSLMDEARGTINRADESMKQMTNSMEEISTSGQEIGKIIKTIDEIAFQTNLLALNAAVEAARAGEAGQGFAVVADEVRNLAQRAADAAKNTSELIEGTIQKIDQGNDLVKSTGEAFSEVAVSATKVGQLVSEIAVASQEQSQGIDQVNTAMSQMDGVTQQNAANAEESASAAEELNAQAESMHDTVVKLLRLVGGANGTNGHSSSHTSSVRTKRLATPQPKLGLPAGNMGETTQVRQKGVVAKANEIISMDDDFSDF